jgi:hypothetical protein
MYISSGRKAKKIPPGWSHQRGVDRQALLGMGQPAPSDGHRGGRPNGRRPLPLGPARSAGGSGATAAAAPAGSASLLHGAVVLYFTGL